MQAAAVRRIAVRRDKHHLAALIGDAQRQNLDMNGPIWRGGKLTTAITFLPTSVSGLYCSVIWAEDLRVPISGPKSITSLIAGLRASGRVLLDDGAAPDIDLHKVIETRQRRGGLILAHLVLGLNARTGGCRARFQPP